MDQAGSKLLRGLLEVFLLETLEREPKHGYAILKELADSFGVEPNRNRLYPLLGKFVKEGWVREVNDATGGRTIYSLTDEGRAQLHAYRRLPRGFRQALGRVWAGEGALAAAASEPEAQAASSAARPVPVNILSEPAPAPTLSAPASSPPSLEAAALPYPCEEARIALSKDPRTGALEMRLTGCPMGAYEYCPQCPVFKSVEGLRRVVFSL